MKVIAHRIIAGQGAKWSDRFPGISGQTSFSKGRALAVRDSKLEDSSKRFLLLDEQTGEVDKLNIDWRATGRPRDLEAVTRSVGEDSFLAIEGSSFREHKARLFEMEITADGGKSEKSHVLPDFGQEIEGLISVPHQDGTELVIFGGRGDDLTGKSKLYWGRLEDDGLHFTPEGLQGTDVSSPELGPGQRSIADLAYDSTGQVMAVAAIDDGDSGPFRSAIYSLGYIKSDGNNPTIESDSESDCFVTIPDTKIEGLSYTLDNELLAGSDNEIQEGRFEGFRLAHPGANSLAK